MDTVIPRVYIPRGVFDNTGDDVFQWLNKFNNHEHIRTVIPDFTYYDLAIGDEVYIYNTEGEEILYNASPALIEYISALEIRISHSASTTLENTVLYYKAPKADVDSRLLFGVNTTEDSQIITFGVSIQNEEFQQKEGYGFPGFISQKQLRELAKATHTQQFYIDPSKNLYPIITNTQYRSWLVDVYTYSSSTVSGRIIYFNPEDDTHIFADTSTWTEYMVSNVFTAGLRKHINIISDRAIVDEPYPDDKPRAPIPINSFIALELTTAATIASELYMTFHFHKLI